MATFTDVARLISTLCGQLGDAGDPASAQIVMTSMTDADVVKILQEATALAQQVEQIQVIAAGVIAMRSKRERGHSGLAASRGHRSASALVQDITGATKADANRRIRVGEALLDDGSGANPDGAGSGDDGSSGDASSGGESAGGASAGEGSTGDGSAGGVSGDDRPSPGPWHQPLSDALRSGVLSSSQFDAIRRGLGEPPQIGADHADADATAAPREHARAAWAQAAEQLVEEAAERTVEELWQQARTIRDLLDPEGAEARFGERHEKRSFRTYRDQDGQKRASIIFDDEGDIFVESVLAAALRPRRGGPRFVDPDEKEQAQSLLDDMRTNDQLAYDLIIDILRAGTLADAKTVFGTRQAGVRLVQVVDAGGVGAPVAHSEDHLVSVPGAVADQHICDSGFVSVTVDSAGNPLDVGREQRRFTPKQRIALAIRDGGCRWHGCDRPASYGEAHHIDEWHRDQGRTDIDRGILLCRYHHMALHHGRWRITRQGKDDFVLHHPLGETFAMRPRGVLRYAFSDIDPPPKRFRQAA